MKDHKFYTKKLMSKLKLLLLTLFNITLIKDAFSNQAKPWQIGFQESASPAASMIIDTHNFIMIFVWITVIFVLLLLTYTCVKFKAKNTPTPSTTSHNTILEIIWIIIPTIIVIIIAIPSIKLLFNQDNIPETEMTLKVIGRQWYWSYEYPDHHNISFDSYMKKDEELLPNDPRLLATDTKIVLPINTYIKVQITSSDVIHSWAVPALGVKKDAVPGRLNETWIYINKAGTYYGQCSELCGILHAFMPIEIKAVSKKEFNQWVTEAKDEYANNGYQIFADNNKLTNIN